MFTNTVEKSLKALPMPEDLRRKLLARWNELKEQKLNIMITGATGSGKSSTINALFNMDSARKSEVAKVGVGVDPETMEIVKYELGNMILWDSPGLGDGKEADNRHARNIIDKLHERDSNGKLLIDLVLVVLDGSTRDLGTSYELINKVIIPNLGENPGKRILVAINQADAAMKGRHWDYDNNRPEPDLVRFLDEKCLSVKRRISEGTGVDIMPIYYSAGFKEEGGEQAPPYNLAKLLYFILENIPAEKRFIAAEHLNTDRTVWQDNDSEGYGKKVRNSIKEGISTGLKGAALGAAIGAAFGPVGSAVGAAIGGFFGFLGGIFG
ncbi:MAG: 50S ribosome-binding GTPase [Lentisphaeria bacterium]|nr:50S ribosome-binding GTPase [Lentisphaeria bacterium]